MDQQNVLNYERHTCKHDSGLPHIHLIGVICALLIPFESTTTPFLTDL